MNKIIRNDCTLIKRLGRLRYKYLKLHHSQSTLNRKSINYFQLYMEIDNLMDEIIKDMRLKALQNINDGCEWKKEYECIFSE